MHEQKNVKQTTQKPLCLTLRDSKQELVNAVNDIMGKHHLPAYLLRGQLEEILHTLREIEKQEIETAEAQYSEAMNSPHEK